MKIKRNFIGIITLILTIIFNSQFVLAAKPNSSVPTAPIGLTTSNISTSSITLGWSSVSGASGYYVYMATPNDTNYTKIATVTSTSLIKSALTANSQYWFYVSAYNRYGTSPS